MAMNNKQLRRLRTREIIRDHAIGSQEHLLKMLKDEGFEITQATLSRDLKKMNVSKIAHPDNTYRYSIPEESLPKTKAEVRGFLSLKFTGQLAIVRTLAGYASPLSVLIDNNSSDLVCGTIAGRDTIFVALNEQDNNRDEFKKYLNDILYENGE